LKDEVDKMVGVGQTGRERVAVRVMAPVRLVQFYSMPVLESCFDQLTQRHAMALGAEVSQQASCDQQAHKAMHVAVLFNPGPIEPDAFIVVAISVAPRTEIAKEEERPSVLSALLQKFARLEAEPATTEPSSASTILPRSRPQTNLVS
jgi:hypothetical protein